MRSGNLETALAAVDDALQIFTEDDRVWCYREKILSLMSAGHWTVVVRLHCLLYHCDRHLFIQSSSDTYLLTFISILFFYSRSHIAAAIAEDCYILAVLFLFPTTDLLTSLGWFLRNCHTKQYVLKYFIYMGVHMCTQSRYFHWHHSIMQGKSGNLKQ